MVYLLNDESILPTLDLQMELICLIFHSFSLKVYHLYYNIDNIDFHAYLSQLALFQVWRPHLPF